MTEFNGLKAETKALVAFGMERNEDAIVTNALPGALRAKAAIPLAAFGKFDFSAKYHADWNTLLNARSAELGALRNQLWDQGHSLVGVAAAYEKTDINASYQLDQKAGGLGSHLNGSWASQQHVTSRPGAVTPPFPDVPTVPGGNGKSAATIPSIEELPPRKVVISPAVRTGSPHGADPGLNREVSIHVPVWRLHPGTLDANDQLHNLVNTHLETLLRVDVLAEQFGLAAPLKTYIKKAYVSSPPVIRNAANECNPIANAVSEMLDEFDTETDNLKQSWWGASPLGVGGASGIYYNLAASTQKYMDGEEGKLRWMYQQGRTVSDTIADLRNAYGKAISEHIGELTKALAAYAKAAANIANCTSTSGVTSVISGFIDALVAAGSTHVAQLSKGFDLESKAIENHKKYEGDSKEYAVAEPFPQIEGGNSYKSSSGWKPQPGRSSVYSK